MWSAAELLIQIQKLHGDFMMDEDRLKNANTVMEYSMDTRQEVKRKLSMCSRGRLASLMKKTSELTVANLHKQVSSQVIDTWTSQGRK